MANVHTHVQSFNAGELSPLLGARFGVEKVASGCRRLRNFLLHVHGPAFRRPGMEHLGLGASSGSKSRLLAFQFSTTTSAVLELHPTGLRVWSNGQLVPLLNPVPLPYSVPECIEVQTVQSNDVMYLAHPNHSPRKLTRFADNDWRIQEIPWKWPAMGDTAIPTIEQAPTKTVLLAYPVPAGAVGVSQAFTAPTGPPITMTMTVVNPDLTAATKTASVRNLFGVVITRTWTTIAPAPLATTTFPNSTMTYSGPAVAAGAVVVTWAGGSATMSLASTTTTNGITLPAGEWQAVAVCPSSVTGMSLVVEQLVGVTWTLIHTFTLTPSALLTYRGTTIVTPTATRIRETGAFFDSGGTASLDKLVFPPAADVTLAVSNAAVGTGRTLTASALIFETGHVGSYWQIAHRRDKAFISLVSAQPTIAAATSAPIRVSGSWQVLTYGTWATTLYLERKTGATWEVVRSWESRKDRNVIANGEESSAVDMRLRVDAGTSEAATGAAVPRFVLEASDSESYGLVRITALGTLTAGKTATATVDVLTALHATTATALWEEGAWSTVRGYPRAVAIHAERLWFGGTLKEPMRLWGSVVADYEDFRRSSLDDAGISFTPAASSSNAIQWLVSKDRELMIGTRGDEWTLSTESGPITPTNVLVQRRSAYGSEYLPARLINESVVFVQRGGRKLRQISPRGDNDPWTATDLTVLAEHVTKGGVVQFAAMTNPFSVLWCVTGDGKLIGMTFEQEQNVFGWHVHETDGRVESVTVIRGADVDEVWLSVKRAVAEGQDLDEVAPGGVGPVLGFRRSVERLDSTVFSRDFDRRGELIYLDAAKKFTGGPDLFSALGPILTGLDHLNDRVVSVMADGSEQASGVVINGSINIGISSTHAIVGLPFTSELQPMRVEIPLRDGTAQGRNFRVARVYATLFDSLGGEIADSPTGRFEALNYRRVSSAMDASPPFFTGEVETAIQSKAISGFDVTIKTSEPYPLNVGSLVFKGDLYGE